MNIQSYINQLTFDRNDLQFTIGCGIAAAFTLFYLFNYFVPVKKTAVGKLSSKAPGISIVITSCNNRSILEKNLPLWLSQDYPNFEVIVADDRSTDETLFFLIEQQQLHPKLQIVSLDPHFVKMGGKKLALTLAIKKSQFQFFLITEVDVVPASNQWLKLMSLQLGNKKNEIVLGASPICSGRGFLATLVQHELLLNSLQFLGLAKMGKPYMGMGKNLAYSRSIYDSVNGFSKHHHLPMGDDVLFVQEAATATNTAICIHPDAYTLGDGPASWKLYWRQNAQKLWIEKSFDSKVKKRIIVYPLLQLSFWIGIIIWFIIGHQWAWPLIALLVKIVPEWIVFYQKGKLLQMNKSIILYPFFNLFESFWFPLTRINSFFSKKIIW